MTDRNASPQQGPPLRYPDRSSPSTSRDHDRVRRGQTTGSPDTGESSRSGSLMNSSWTADATLAHDDPTEHRHDNDAREAKSSQHPHKSHKYKSTGAFLLSDPFDEPAADDLRGRKQRSRRTAAKGKRASTRHSHEDTPSIRQSGVGLGLPPDLKMSNGSAGQTPGTPPRVSTTGAARRPEDFLHPSPGAPSPGSSNASADMDSNQIVNMALNLSESRRLAQRRAASQTIPPRLAPLPADNIVAGTLRQQLQQQRRVSRTISPRPRVVSGGKSSCNGTLQSPFEPMGAEDRFQYSFSNSTLARAQKAKDYMELLAQYRRVIELVPPLKPNSLSKASPRELSPSMPMSLDTVNATGQIGRPYDPLQYIRNRKVRARERKTIDGDSQGFGDVSRVTDWIDDVAKWVATRQVRTPGSPALPPFSGSDVFSMDHSPPALMLRTVNAPVKTKRPRNDWIFEPSDLLADIYWLEQDDHKKLVENRNWQRVFPQDSGLYRPMSRGTNELFPDVGRQFPGLSTAPDGEHYCGRPGLNAKSQQVDAMDYAPSSTREKAREKLREIRGLHRHPTLLHGDKHVHSRLRGRRDSSSSSSSSNSGTRSRRNTIGASDKDLLEKQMLEMMAREAREDQDEEDTRSQDVGLKELKPRPSDVVAAQPGISTPGSVASSLQHSSGEFHVEISDKEDKIIGGHLRKASSPQRPSRESLEVPSFRGRRMSIGSESSAPNSPDFRASRMGHYFAPAIGAELSPASSRGGSPSRNPLSRVKQIFRDRSRDRQQEMASGDKGVFTDPAVHAAPTSNPDGGPEKAPSQSRTNSVGPETRLATRNTGESHRSHHKPNSLRVVEPGAGLRGLFKGPRIDSVLKSGVSRVSDLFWKKDSEAEDSDSTSSTSDDSEDESRGRREKSNSLSPTPSLRGRPSQPKPEGQYLDVMPAFVSTAQHRGTLSRQGSINAPVSRKNSRRSTRFELLKPPRIDISAATDVTFDQADKPVADTTESKSRHSRSMSGIKNGHRTLNRPVYSPVGHRVTAESVRNSRHFSIAEQDMPWQHNPISRHEVARLRTTILSSGIMAMELSRRANGPTTLTATTRNEDSAVLAALGPKIAWSDLAQLISDDDQRAQLLSQPIPQADLFPLTAHILGTAIQNSRDRWHSEANQFKHRTRVELIDGRIEKLRQRVGLDLTAMTRAAAEEADDVGEDVVDGQRQKVKSVMDVIDKLLRRRRRRFRWVRRAGWLALEWLLVGFMWYVWFVVMIARVFLGVGKGLWNGVRWLLWL